MSLRNKQVYWFPFTPAKGTLGNKQLSGVATLVWHPPPSLTVVLSTAAGAVHHDHGGSGHCGRQRLRLLLAKQLCETLLVRALYMRSQVALPVARELAEGAGEGLLARVRTQVDDVALLARVLLPASLALVHVLAAAPTLAVVEGGVVLKGRKEKLIISQTC
jgi:hypothetical protein